MGKQQTSPFPFYHTTFLMTGAGWKTPFYQPLSITRVESLHCRDIKPSCEQVHRYVDIHRDHLDMNPDSPTL